MFNLNTRFFIVTGKGGVGKTTIAHSLIKSLNRNNKEAKLINLDTKNDLVNISCVLNLRIKDCLIEYIAMKLKSESVARWIVKTPFFSSLISMMPGFSYLIYLGKIYDLLEKNPKLTLVLDSPSSGHALTMFESLQNFQEIFQSGLLFEDTKKVIDKIYQPDFARILIVSIPTQLSLSESFELEKEIKSIKPINCTHICNNSLLQIKDLQDHNLKSLLSKKVLNEKKILENYQKEIKVILPLSLNEKPEDIQNELSFDIETLL